jgi:hypothetical protein
LSAFSITDFTRNYEKSNFYKKIDPKTLYVNKRELSQLRICKKIEDDVTKRLYKSIQSRNEKYLLLNLEVKIIKNH